MHRTLPRLTIFWLAASLLTPVPSVAQQPPVAITYGDGRRAQATRAELEASLVDIDKVVASPGYSARLRDARQREAELIRERLTEGDLQVGDQLQLTVLGEAQFTGIFLIGAGRVLTLPGIGDIPLRGVLRAEAEEYLVKELRKQIRDPQVQVQTNIRLLITGAVGKPGFYQVPADIMPTDAIMVAAGGFAQGADPNRTSVRRRGQEIWSREAFQDALLRGLTLDQLNLRTNDEILVQAKAGSPLQTIMVGLGAISSAAWLLFRVAR